MRVVRQAEAADQGLSECRQDGLQQGLGDAAVHLTNGADHVGLQNNGGDRGFDLFRLIVYFIQLSPSAGAFLAEMAGQQTELNGRETKLA